ncbi:MAG TPA: hypothetical protein VHV78_00415, partial [Gemmatimonadaceae bacterium]|nr:hypothetical protein [Gemmatimonadaceae bacterium]
MSIVGRALLALMLIAGSAIAQDPRLATRLDKPTQVAVNAIVDSARRDKLPTTPLVNKALEGSAKGSDGPTVASAVHQLYMRMGSAKHALGPTATADE